MADGPTRPRKSLLSALPSAIRHPPSAIRHQRSRHPPSAIRHQRSRHQPSAIRHPPEEERRYLFDTLRPVRMNIIKSTVNDVTVLDIQDVIKRGESARELSSYLEKVL